MLEVISLQNIVCIWRFRESVVGQRETPAHLGLVGQNESNVLDPSYSIKLTTVKYSAVVIQIHHYLTRK